MSEFNQVVKDGFNKVVAFVRRFFILLSVLAIVGGGLYIWISGWTYSEGTRAGTLIKMTHKGVVFKTFEGELNLGGFQTDAQSGLSGNIWSFSVNNRKVYEDLQNYEGKQVQLHYRQRYRSFAWQGKTEYFVDKVEPVE